MYHNILVALEHSDADRTVIDDVQELARLTTPFRAAITFPWEVPPETVIVEFEDGLWRVVPHHGMVLTFQSREEALAWARIVASRYLRFWRVVEKPQRDTDQALRWRA